MNKNIFRCASLGAALLALSELPAAGQGTFQKFVTVGDSLIAGEESACVVQRFQERSWVALAARSLGQDDFQQPWIQELAATNPLTSYPCAGATFSGTSVGVGVVSMVGPNLNATLPRPYDNLGFNGSPTIADFVDLTVTVPGSSELDNIAAKVLRNFAGGPFYEMSAVDQANMLEPDLVAFWGGNNDALNAMGAGVAILGVTLTPVASFTASFDEVMAGLSATGRTLVVFNIPDVSSIPYATTIPPIVVNPATRLPVVVDGQFVPLLGPGDAAFPCVPVAPNTGCPLPPGSLVTLPASSLLGQGIGIPRSLGGTGQPLPHGSFTPPSTLDVGVVLYPDDVALIQETTDGYNEAITSAVSTYGAILIDANALLRQVKAEGYEIGGITLTSTYVTGGLFSYDGVHPSAIGYGVIADAFIRTLNAATGTNYPRPNFSEILYTPNCYPGTFGCPAAQPVSASVVQAGPWNYSLGMWQNLLSTSLSPRGMQVAMPQAPRLAPQAPRTVPEASGRPTRTVPARHLEE
jgi:hypothetical protein